MRRTVILGAAPAAIALAATAIATAGAASTPQWIVFPAQPGGTQLPQLFRVQTDGTGLQQITTGANPATNPAFSPDGTRVVFARLGSGIFRVNLDGTGLHRLTSGTRDSYPVYSPDGKRIAFVRIYKAQWRLFVMSASGAGQHRLRLSPPTGRPSWSKDGKSIFIPAAGGLAKVSSKTGQVEQRYDVALDPAVSQAATVSPDMRSVAFVSKRTETGPEDCGESRCPQYALYTADFSGRHRRRVANDTGPGGWSPDGKTLAFISRGALALSTLATGKRTAIPVGTNVAGGDTPPAWQPR